MRLKEPHAILTLLQTDVDKGFVRKTSTKFCRTWLRKLRNIIITCLFWRCPCKVSYTSHKIENNLTGDPLHQRSCRLRHRLKRYIRKIRIKKLRNREDRLPIFSVFDQSVSRYMELIEKPMRNAFWRLKRGLKGPFWKKWGRWFPQNMTSRIEKAQLSLFSLTSTYHFSDASEENWWLEYWNTSCKIEFIERSSHRNSKKNMLKYGEKASTNDFSLTSGHQVIITKMIDKSRGSFQLCPSTARKLSIETLIKSIVTMVSEKKMFEYRIKWKLKVCFLEVSAFDKYAASNETLLLIAERVFII